MKKIVLFAIALSIMSCGVSDERIDAYKRAAKKVRKAKSSDALEMIAYDLSKELYQLDAENISLSELKRSAQAGDEDSKEIVDAISKAKRKFNETLSDKETTFYLQRLSDK